MGCLHVGNSQGQILIEDCDFSGAGDDCINLHDNSSMGVRRLDSHTRLQGSHGRVEHNLFENIQGAAIQIEAGCETCWGSCSSPTAGTAWRRKT